MASSIASTEYDANARTYSVQFKAGGPIYVYKDVDPATAREVEGADSKGAAIGQYLRGSFDFYKVDPSQDQQ